MALDPKYSILIKATIAIEKKTINQYYDKTDHSKVFHIAMGIIFLIISFLFLANFLF